MAGSLWVKIDRRFENLVRSQKREKVGGKPLITCDILAFFRLVTGFEPTDYQVRFLLDPSQFVVARWSRQTGKSLTLSVLCLYTVLSGSDVDPSDSLVPAEASEEMGGRAGVEDEALLCQRVHD